MFFVLSKILSFFFKPLSWVFILLISGLVLKDVKKKQRLFFAAVVLLYVLSNPFFFNVSNDIWSIKTVKIHGEYDAAVVLLGFTSLITDPKEMVHVSSAVNRITQLIPLYRKGVVRKIVLSGGSSSLKGHAKSEAEEVKKLLLEWKVDEVDIIIEKGSRNTYENLKNCKTILHQFDKILLVTSSYHMRRSMACANKLDIQVTPFVTDYIKVKYESVVYYLIPDLESFKGFNYLIHEWVGYVAYWLRGYC